MRIRSEVFHVPKSGNSDDEYEDAYCPSESIDVTQGVVRFAVADGATETSFSAFWAELLVTTYCSGRFDEGVSPEVLENLRSLWLDKVGSRSLSWYGEQKLEQGAFSSLLGLTIKISPTPELRSVAVGDSCLFHIRDNQLVKSFPLSHSGEFNSRPELLSTNSTQNKQALVNIAEYRATLHGDDTLYLMTDAIAWWFLHCAENGKKPWLFKQVAFEEWISRLRKRKNIRNDDVTMVRIECWQDEND